MTPQSTFGWWCVATSQPRKTPALLRKPPTSAICRGRASSPLHKRHSGRQKMLAMSPVLSISHLSKTYATGLTALDDVSLDIRRGEIFALLGPNGAGKTTLISIVCGIVNPSGGTVRVDGHDIVKNYRAARSEIGLVPQELTTDAFETVWATVSFSRGLFGKGRNPRISKRSCASCRCGRRRTAGS